MNAIFRKRRYPRRQFLQRVGVLMSGKYLIGSTLEIGEGGIRISVPVEMEVGHSVVLSFLVAGGDYVVVTSEVRFCHEDLGEERVFGMMFTDLDFDKKRIIRDYIAAKTEEEAREDLAQLEKAI